MHTDLEVLSLLALGEQVGSDSERLHAETCPDCSAELAELRRVVTVGREVDAEMAIVAPSDEVWARIRDELEFGPELVPPVRQSLFLVPDITEPAAVSAHDDTEAESAGDHPRRSLLATIKAALAGTSHEHEPTAHAMLKPVGSYWSNASGTAELAMDDKGRRIMQVDLHADLPSSGVRQAWLIHRDDPTVRQSLGILDGVHGLWTVDQSIDLSEYPILDISQQGTGETEHSGQTIVRGELALVS